MVDIYILLNMYKAVVANLFCAVAYFDSNLKSDIYREHSMVMVIMDRTPPKLCLQLDKI